jgi:hypothetical protein
MKVLAMKGSPGGCFVSETVDRQPKPYTEADGVVSFAVKALSSQSHPVLIRRSRLVEKRMRILGGPLFETHRLSTQYLFNTVTSGGETAFPYCFP